MNECNVGLEAFPDVRGSLLPLNLVKRFCHRESRKTSSFTNPLRFGCYSSRGRIHVCRTTTERVDWGKP